MIEQMEGGPPGPRRASGPAVQEQDTFETGQAAGLRSGDPPPIKRRQSRGSLPPAEPPPDPCALSRYSAPAPAVPANDETPPAHSRTPPPHRVPKTLAHKSKSAPHAPST